MALIISSDCAKALNQTVSSYDQSLRNLVLEGIYLLLNATGAAVTLCTSTCETSLTSYQSNITKVCKSSPVISSEVTNIFMEDLLRDYYDLICTKDPGTGEYCTDYLTGTYANVPHVTQWSQLSHGIICSSCQISYFETIQKSSFLGYSTSIALDWKTIQQAYGLSSALDMLTNDISFTVTVTTILINTIYTSQKLYTVKSEDSCKSITLANSVAQSTIWTFNNLSPNCSTTVSQSLCLPKSCKTYTIKPNDSCFSIVSDNNITYNAFLNYNPTINPDCTNLHNTSVVYISNPDGDYVILKSLPGNDTSSSSNTNQYADNVVAAPGPVPFGTITQCGGYYQVQVTDTCEQISLAARVSVELFEEINPSIDSNCFNLITGLWYCVHPTVNWNSTSTNSTGPSTTLLLLGPTPPGTTNSCFE
ncbi:hypothetical protein F5884DRAFT_856227 [Xylogone sp. PMI_703]|nr:hypothetical protein F5884DRAFT_856227 [Xylogone sp. PMI_703]